MFLSPCYVYTRHFTVFVVLFDSTNNLGVTYYYFPFLQLTLIILSSLNNHWKYYT